MTVSPPKETVREEKDTEEVDEAPLLPVEEIVQRHFSMDSLCNFSKLNEHLESDLNKDVVKHFELHEKEKLSNKWTRYEIIITGVKGSRVMWPKNKEVCSNITLIK